MKDDRYISHAKYSRRDMLIRNNDTWFK